MAQKESNPRTLTLFGKEISNVVFNVGTAKKAVAKQGKCLNGGSASSRRFRRKSVDNQLLVFFP